MEEFLESFKNIKSSIDILDKTATLPGFCLSPVILCKILPCKYLHWKYVTCPIKMHYTNKKHHNCNASYFMIWKDTKEKLCFFISKMIEKLSTFEVWSCFTIYFIILYLV